ncbi:hypothetical protein [Magnetococcus sp. PR-3]|uniref:hypothetical protein n=1 Tax=Magnetococcus sp. PR-3 TaxID=3120355 RepID=UPI002FCE256F
MHQIYRYPNHLKIRYPEGGDPNQPVVYLCELDGQIYLSVPLDYPKAEQWQGPVEFTEEPDLKHQLRKQALPCLEINEKLQADIRDRYSLEDELRALRVGDPEYHTFVEGLVSQADAAKAALGL